jgi:hypothetical protein
VILQVICALVAASALPYSTSTPTPTPVLPSDCGLTEEQVLRAVIPDYDGKLARFRNAGAEDKGDFRFNPRVTAAVKTGFGWPAKNLMVVTADSSVGQCEGCHTQVVAVIDLPTRSVLWRAERGGTSPGWPIRFFLDGPGLPAFSIREYSGSSSWGYEISETLFGPRFGPRGTLECDLLWEGLVDFGMQGNQDGDGFAGCGELLAPDVTGTFTYERRTFIGREKEDLEEGEEPSASRDAKPESQTVLAPCLPWGEPPHGAVEIKRTESWTPQANAHKLIRRNVAAERINHFPTNDFPFGLPVRDEKFFTSLTKVGVCIGADGVRSIPSPDRNLTAITQGHRCYFSCSVQVVDRGNQVLRDIKLGPYVSDTPVAVGWSAGNRRVYAVVMFGQDESALLSFSADGTDDYWERLLGRGPEGWQDGFVVSPYFSRWEEQPKPTHVPRPQR